MNELNLKQRCPSSVNYHIHDDLLMNILIRLPYKSADRLRHVSKHWFFLISSPKFGIEYLRYKRDNNNNDFDDDEEKHAPWTFVVNILTMVMPTIPRFDASGEYWLASSEKVFESPNFTKLEFLPDNKNKKTIASIFSDLILCFSVDESSMERSYFICNPVSKQWVALPPSPFLPLSKPFLLPLPFLIFDKDISRFRVVVVHHPFAGYYLQDPADDYNPNYANFFPAIVFCSESWEWKQVNLKVPTLQPGHSYSHDYFQGVVCERPCSYLHDYFQGIVSGRLLYLSHGHKFGVFDPFDVVSDVVDAPSYITAKLLLPSRRTHQDYILMECAKKLIVVRTQQDRYGGCSWVMQRLEENTNTDTNDDGPLAWKVVSTGRVKFKFVVIGVHPRNHNLLHVLFNCDKVATLDLKSRHLEPMGTTYKSLNSLRLRSFHRLQLQRWPTPIPTLN